MSLAFALPQIELPKSAKVPDKIKNLLKKIPDSQQINKFEKKINATIPSYKNNKKTLNNYKENNKVVIGSYSIENIGDITIMSSQREFYEKINN